MGNPTIRRKHDKTICKFCKKEFEYTYGKNENPIRKFCSTKCHNMFIYNPNNHRTFMCDTCKKEFSMDNRRKVYNHHFCSRECYYKWFGKAHKGKNNPFFGKKHSIDTKIKIMKGRLKIPNAYFKYGYDTEKHKKLKLQVGAFLESKGYEVFYEVCIFNIFFRVADVVGLKGQEKVVVECGTVDKKKFKEYSDIFQWIIHVPYKGEIKLIKGLF